MSEDTGVSSYRLTHNRGFAPIDLILYLIRGVGHEYGRVRITGGHLCLWALQRGEELGMNQAGLGVFQLLGHVPRQPEVWVLIYSTRD